MAISKNNEHRSVLKMPSTHPEAERGIEEIVDDFIARLSVNIADVKTTKELAKYWIRKTLLEVNETHHQELQKARAEVRDQEAKFWFETWYSTCIAPVKPRNGEFASFATERIQMTGYERDQSELDQPTV